MQLFRPCRPYVWEEVALTYFFLHEVMAKQVRHSPIRSIQSFLRSCVERLRHRGGRGVVPPVVASMLGGFRDHKKNSLVDFQGGGWDPATSPNKYHMRITTPAAAAAVQRKPPTANAAAAGPIGELPAAPLQTAEVLALDTAAPAPAPAEPGAGPAADTNAPDATTPQPSPTDATTPPADAAGATAAPPPAPGPPVQQQQQQQQQPPHSPTAPMFAVDRLKLLASLQHTLSKAGDHPEYDDIDWEHELPAQVLEREADREYAKVMHMDVTMRLPQFERVMPDDEPLTSDSLLRIADDLMANSFNETSTSASERTATDIVYRSGVSPDKAVRDNVPDNFDTLLAGSQLLDKTASELERLQRSIRSARSKKPDSPDRLQREVSATASRVPEEVVIPMRRRLFEPKRAGEELRRYHEVTKQVLSEQRELQDEKQATVTGAKRAQNQERHFILNTQRKEEKVRTPPRMPLRRGGGRVKDPQTPAAGPFFSCLPPITVAAEARPWLAHGPVRGPAQACAPRWLIDAFIAGVSRLGQRGVVPPAAEKRRVDAAEEETAAEKGGRRGAQGGEGADHQRPVAAETDGGV